MALFKRGDIWWFEFHLQGIRIRESAKTRVREEAAHAEALRRVALASRKDSTGNALRSPGFREFANTEFAVWCANEHKDSISTHARYMRSVKALAEFFGNRRLNEIDGGWVERYKIYRSQQKRKNARDGRLVSSAGVNRDLALLRILFNFAIRLGQASQNPVHGVRFLKERNQHMRVLSPKEEARYLDAASPLLRDVAILILETGMRPGEVCHLRTEDVDLEQAFIQIRRGKTNFAKRFIPLTGRGLEMLKPRKDSAQNEWMFPSPKNPARPVVEVRRAHDAAVLRSGLRPVFRLYDLRHTALSRMAMAGIDLATLKEIAGHSQIQMTMRYVHPTPEHKRMAMRKFEQGMASARAEDRAATGEHIAADA